MKEAPVNYGPCTEAEFLVKAVSIIKQYMARDPDNLNFSMIVLAPANSE
jgi:hypothetical protein